MKVYVPLDKYNKLAEKIIATKAFIFSLLKAIDPSLNLQREINTIFENRYHTLVKKGHFSVNSTEFDDLNRMCSSKQSKQQFRIMKTKFENDISVLKVSKLFRSLQDNVRIIWFHNFVEYMLALCINLEKIPILLASNCFS